MIYFILFSYRRKLNSNLSDVIICKVIAYEELLWVTLSGNGEVGATRFEDEISQLRFLPFEEPVGSLLLTQNKFTLRID